jgi:hypothetical protein
MYIINMFSWDNNNHITNENYLEFIKEIDPLIVV